MMPNRHVAIAGTVLKMPSGSQVLPPLQTCVPITLPFSTRLSMYSQKLPCGSRPPVPHPSIGPTIISTQYPASSPAIQMICPRMPVFR